MSSHLSTYFTAIAAKRLSQVEIAPKKSNQHEFNGIKEFKRILGSDKISFETTYILLSDEEENVISDKGIMTWYNAREQHATRNEFRLYYNSNEVIKSAFPGDLLVIGKLKNEKFAVIIAPKDSTVEKQLLWLFKLADLRERFTIKDFSDDKSDLGFAGRYIMSSLGFDTDEIAPNYTEEILSRFGKVFPSTNEFSAYARSTVKHVSPIEEPDKTLMIWMEREELLFKTLESVIVREQLEKGFGKDGKDVDAFIKFSLSVQNRRKSRAGFAFENNLALIFSLNQVPFSHGKITERNNKPDFVFPDIKEYHNPDFNVELLIMLGVKTTAKDRWRQVLSEAERINKKHLITLEPAISKNQTDDMLANNLQLVIPEPLINTYQDIQKEQLLTLVDFINLIKKKNT